MKVLEAIKTKSKKYNYVAIRMAVAYNMRRKGITYKNIGTFIGKDHSTVVYLVKRCEQLLEVNDKVMIDTIKNLYNDNGTDI